MPLSHAQDHLQQGLERTCLQHEAWTWDLVHVLFESLAGEQEGEAPGQCPAWEPRSATISVCDSDVIRIKCMVLMGVPCENVHRQQR